MKKVQSILLKHPKCDRWQLNPETTDDIEIHHSSEINQPLGRTKKHPPDQDDGDDRGP